MGVDRQVWPFGAPPPPPPPPEPTKAALPEDAFGLFAMLFGGGETISGVAAEDREAVNGVVQLVVGFVVLCLIYYAFRSGMNFVWGFIRLLPYFLLFSVLQSKLAPALRLVWMLSNSSGWLSALPGGALSKLTTFGAGLFTFQNATATVVGNAVAAAAAG